MAKKFKSAIAAALDFIVLAQKDKGAPYQTHVSLGNRMAIAFDGVLSAGHAIEEDITACPHTFTLVAALKKCTGAFALTQMNTGRLAVRCGAFRASIACLPAATIPNIAPDPQIGVIDNRIREALAAVTPLIAENSQRVVMASALLKSGSCFATNGYVMVEYWHGIDLPPVIIPKIFITALLKIEKNLVGFGFSQSTFTVYFEDGSWLKTQLYDDKWPDCSKILDATRVPPRAVPEDFFKALHVVDAFAEDSRVRLRTGMVYTHKDENIGASYEVKDLIANATFNIKHLLIMEERIKLIDFGGYNGISYFFGDNLRGAITQLKEV